MPEHRNRRASALGLLAWSFVAACSSVPDVVFVDPDTPSPRDRGVPEDSDDGGASVDATAPTDAGCVVAKDEVCCGSSVCSKKECEGNGLRCTACSLTCGGRRCCDRPNGLGVECVDIGQKCKP